MALDADLIKKFVEVTNDTGTAKETGKDIYGTAKVTDTGIYVQLDGSDILTPVSMDTDAKDGDRVLVTIENHKARISSNITSPASGRGATDLYSETVDSDGNLVVSGELRAAKEYVDTLIADDVTTGRLKASVGYIDDLTAKDITAESIKANEADIEKLKTDSLTANSAVIKNLEATKATVDTLVTGDVTTDTLRAASGYISELKSKNVTAEDINATKATVDTLVTGDVTTDTLRAASGYISELKSKNVTAEDINATKATIGTLVTGDVTTDTLRAASGYISELKSKNITAEDINATKATVDTLDTTYASIDFANINQAAVEKLFSDSGIIKDLIVSDGKITGELVGVTIKGDLIEANSLKADKLVVLGEDGLYYKLNVNALGETTASSDPKYQTGLDGSVIVAKSITAEKVAVDDLVAFNATIGGFNITKNSIYSGVKSSVGNTTRGIYLDNTGQFAFGEGTNFITYYKSTDGTYKLAISADNIRLGSGIVINDVADEAIKATEEANKVVDAYNKGELNGEDAVTLRIDSSRGTVFKNNAISTVLSAVIYKGSERITDIAKLHEVFGSRAYLEWSWQKIDDNTFGTILSTDKMVGNDGFTLTITADEVDEKVTFMCELKD